MLIQFGFKNYKSFRDDTILDMSATKISEYSERVISIGNEKILPVAAIFGANAHGKSNVLDAFNYMHIYVIESLNFAGDSSDKSRKSKFMGPTPFLFDHDSKDAESSFEVYFVDETDNAKTYNYGFTVSKQGVGEEWLNYRAKTSKGDFKRIFYRNLVDDILDMPGIPKKSQENIKVALEKEVLIVSLGAKLKVAKLKQIRDWFFKNEFANFGHPMANLVLSNRAPKGFGEDEKVRRKVVDYFAAFDSSIVDFNVEVVKSEEDEDEYLKVEAVHKMIGSDEKATLPLQSESSGTLKMFALYPMLQEVLENGGVFVIDELNARLHPLLVRNFLLTFLNQDINIKNAQLIFTTHDAWQLSGNGLRRDEIWFTEKDKDGVSTLYSLADFVDEDGDKIRKDANYEKNYLLGKYGAIPTLEYFDMFKGV